MDTDNFFFGFIVGLIIGFFIAGFYISGNHLKFKHIEEKLYVVWEEQYYNVIVEEKE